MKSKVDETGLTAIAARLKGLRSLSFAVNNRSSESVSDLGLELLQGLPNLEAVQLNLSGSRFPLKWYRSHFGADVAVAPHGSGGGGSSTSSSSSGDGGSGGGGGGAWVLAGGGSGISNVGIAGLSKCPALREVWFGTTVFTGQDTDRGAKKEVQQQQHGFDDGEDLDLSFAEWVWQHRSSGIDALRSVLRSRAARGQ
jgi:hypothetical protein